MKIQMSVNGAVIATATLDSHDNAVDFAAMLPLDLHFTDYVATEKIADLPRKVSVQGAPAACTPVAGDVAYYAPWGNLAIFYADGELSVGLVRLGRLDSGVDAMRGSLAGTVTVERVQD